MKSFYFLFVLPFFISCVENSPAEKRPDTKEVKLAEGPWEFPFDIDQPDTVFNMPDRLREISGLSMSPDGQWLLAVNDEDGEIFYIDKRTGEVDKEEVDFEGGGDYEGVEAVGETIFVVKSNGKIYEVTHVEEEDQDTDEHNNFLNGSNNVEGLGYDPEKNQLLLACKGVAGEKLRGQRAIYAFDLERQNLLKEPAYIIDRGTISSYFKAEGVAQEIIEIMSPDKAADAFAPSGLAVHPHTRQLYLVASDGKMLVVLSPMGDIQYMKKLNAEMFRQPEGICFDQDGTMYISSEGKMNYGKVFVFGVKK